MRPVDPPEDRRVEPSRQLIERPVVGRPRHRVCYHDYGLVYQRSVNHLVGLDQHEPFAGADGQLVAAALPGLDGLDDPFEIGRATAGSLAACSEATRRRARSSVCSSRSRRPA